MFVFCWLAYKQLSKKVIKNLNFRPKSYLIPSWPFTLNVQSDASRPRFNTPVTAA